MNNAIAIMRNRQEKEGLTDERFATLLGIHRTTWAKVKSGVRNPGLKLLNAFDRQFPHERIFYNLTTDAHQTRQDKPWGALRALARVFTLGLYKGGSSKAK